MQFIFVLNLFNTCGYDFFITNALDGNDGLASVVNISQRLTPSPPEKHKKAFGAIVKTMVPKAGGLR
jgi:hypothetical protein